MDSGTTGKVYYFMLYGMKLNNAVIAVMGAIYICKFEVITYSEQYLTVKIIFNTNH